MLDCSHPPDLFRENLPPKYFFFWGGGPISYHCIRSHALHDNSYLTEIEFYSTKNTR